MTKTNITKTPFEIIYGENPRIIGSFSEFRHIAYVTNREKIKVNMKNKTYKAIMVGYTENHTRDTYKIYNPGKKGNHEYIY